MTRSTCSACGRSFSCVGLFDRHRHSRGEHGGCIDPETILNGDGYRTMFYRDGAWRGPEMTPEEIAGRRKGSR